MSESKTIKTIESSAEHKFKEKGSLFIGLSFHIETETQVSDLLASLKKKYYDATHVCHAYKLADDKFKYSDDGEPSGSAGIRIYNAILHNELTNCFVASIRYYGGTKLGIGPLGKAYYNSANSVLNESKIITLTYYDEIKIYYQYNQTKTVHHFLGNHNAVQINPGFDAEPFMLCKIERKNFAALKDDLTAATNAKIKIEIVKQDILI